jgi:hypothetical protein
VNRPITEKPLVSDLVANAIITQDYIKRLKNETSRKIQMPFDIAALRPENNRNQTKSKTPDIRVCLTIALNNDHLLRIDISTKANRLP